MLVNFLGRIIEGGWLIALLGIPVFFNPYTTRVFEADKTFLLRSLAAIMLVAWLVRSLINQAHLKNTIKTYRLPVILVFALAIIYFISSIFSITPYFSFWGYFLREEGFYTMVCYLLIFFIILSELREREQLDRIINTIILSATVLSLYGILQHYKIDTVSWAAGERTRVTTTLGNPIFAGAYLIMVIPLILSRGLQSISLGLRQKLPAIISYTLILSINLYCMLLTKSRGPFIGLLISVFFYFILFVRLKQARWLFRSMIIISIIVITFFVVLNIPQGPLSGIRKHFGRFAELYEMEKGGGKVRLLIWEGAVSILKDSPERIAFGHGLESLFPLYHKHIPPAFGRFEGSAIPDHSHNETFDILITSGFLGLLAYLVIISLLLYYVLARLGFFPSPYARRLFFISISGGFLIGLLLPLFLNKVMFIGLTMPFGFLAGLIVYLLFTWQTERVKETPTQETLLLIGLISAIIGHFVELQFGIGVTSTRLHFWVYIALALYILRSCQTAPTGLPSVAPTGLPSVADH
ncbi:MAG: O-antigen ligase family protein, partial [Planctomycetota bacterium]|nr:O-antigen ligase family protein [Planctomycetota bacterium]